ncbi:MAG: fibronectin type III domain-containing protein, partial [Spirochaetota bacterium]
MKNRGKPLQIALVILLTTLLASCSFINQLLGNTETSIGAPATVNAIAGDGQVIVTWSQVTGADGYTVYRRVGTDVSLSANDGASSASGSTVTITGLTNGVQYSFVVYATKGQTLSSA